MANTKSSAKRARQTVRKNARNQVVRSATRTALRLALEAIRKQDLETGKKAYHEAVRALSKAASKGAIPSQRAARKISRLTLLSKKSLPGILPFAQK